MIQCRLCKSDVFDGINLSNGGLIHYECVSSLEAKSYNLQKEISSLHSELSYCERELVRRRGIGFKIVSFFAKPVQNSSEIENLIPGLKKKITDASNSLKVLRSQLSDVYDFYLTYPADWDTRRAALIQEDGERCDNCGDTRNLHMHHRIPLSNGGSNKISNLELLCGDCHSAEHGDRKFSGDFFHNETAFSKRVSNIRYAINQKRKIEFLYKKPNQTIYKKRTISPIELNNVAHERDIGQTLCIRGYCELRNAERNFALKRMKNLKVL